MAEEQLEQIEPLIDPDAWMPVGIPTTSDAQFDSLLEARQVMRADTDRNLLYQTLARAVGRAEAGSFRSHCYFIGRALIDLVTDPVHDLSTMPWICSANPDDWILWRFLLETLSALNNWTEERKRHILLHSMYGAATAASDGVDVKGNPNSDPPRLPPSVGKLMGMYEKRYFSDAQKTMAIREFLEARQQFHEASHEWAIRVMLLCRRTGPPGEMKKNQSLIRQFVTNLYNREIRDYVYARQPETISRALCHVNNRTASIRHAQWLMYFKHRTEGAVSVIPIGGHLGQGQEPAAAVDPTAAANPVLVATPAIDHTHPIVEECNYCSWADWFAYLLSTYD